MTRIAGHCPRCGIDLNPCPYCAAELAGLRRPLAPNPSDPRHATVAVSVPGANVRRTYGSLTVERRRPPLALWRRDTG